MKKYLIVYDDPDGYGGNNALLTNDLETDFIKKFHITYDEEYEDNDIIGLRPIISNVRCLSNCLVSIYKLDLDSKYQREIGNFNFYTSDYEDELQEFIQEYHWEIISPIDLPKKESKIHRFSNFK